MRTPRHPGHSHVVLVSSSVVSIVCPEGDLIPHENHSGLVEHKIVVQTRHLHPLAIGLVRKHAARGRDDDRIHDAACGHDLKSPGLPVVVASKPSLVVYTVLHIKVVRACGEHADPKGIVGECMREPTCGPRLALLLLIHSESGVHPVTVVAPSLKRDAIVSAVPWRCR